MELLLRRMILNLDMTEIEVIIFIKIVNKKCSKNRKIKKKRRDLDIYRFKYIIGWFLGIFFL